MGKRYFGTDGIRGRVGEAPMTPAFALQLGWAAGSVLGAGAPEARVLIGKDTRRSGYLFESALEAGFSAAGVGVELVGPLPTPAVAFLARVQGARAGVVISASHNPHHDNGVKFFSAEGGKLDDALEQAIEDRLEQPLQCVAPERLGLVRRLDDARARYVEHCCGLYQGAPLDGLRLVVDCAHGAAYQTAPAVLRRLGADVIAIADHPDGFNINHECGSTDLRLLARTVVAQGADLGIALDGDADRCLLVDAQGRTVDGDQILYLLAQDRQARGVLQGPVVGTLMSNLGLELALRERGIGFERAKVGDRYVYERLRETGGMLGGETSGHTLSLDRGITGDGIVTALQVLEVLQRHRQPLATLLADLTLCPQVLINVRIGVPAAPVLSSTAVAAAERSAAQHLAGRGRILLRASGTEPLIRVMVEARDGEECRRVAEDLAAVVRAAAH
ncbi:MAG TPA: phosphoglucosamine mutase [Nevskiaceae bacterium]|nr:phosphoglucosamine mutase [Nevskiaceae bacterium]